jgi:hypothetical protein
MGFTVPVSITATLYATDRGRTLSLGQSSELTVCAELSLSKDVLQAVDAAHAEPAVQKGVFVLSATSRPGHRCWLQRSRKVTGKPARDLTGGD